MGSLTDFGERLFCREWAKTTDRLNGGRVDLMSALTNGVTAQTIYPIGDGTNIEARGQSFTGDGGKADEIVVYMIRSTTRSKGWIWCEIYAHTGTYGTSGVPTGSVLATSELIDYNTLQTTARDETFRFMGDQQITLTNGTKYVVVIKHDANAGCYAIPRNNTASPDGNGCYYQVSSWTASSTDIAMEVRSKGSNLYVGLLRSSPSETSDGLENSGNGYMRQKISFGAPVSGVVLNDAKVTFPAATADWLDIVSIGIYDHADTGGGNLITADQQTATSVSEGDVVTIEIGDLEVDLGILNLPPAFFDLNAIMNWAFRYQEMPPRPAMWMALHTGTPSTGPSYDTAIEDSLDVGGGGTANIGQGQSFTGNGNEIASVSFMVKNGLSTPLDGYVVARIYAHSGTYGTSSVPTGTALATSEPLLASDIVPSSESQEQMDFFFYGDQQVTLTNSTYYVATIELVVDTNTGQLNCGETNDSLGGNNSWWSGTLWTVDNADLSIRILTIDATSTGNEVTFDGYRRCKLDDCRWRDDIINNEIVIGFDLSWPSFAAMTGDGTSRSYYAALWDDGVAGTNRKQVGDDTITIPADGADLIRVTNWGFGIR